MQGNLLFGGGGPGAPNGAAGYVGQRRFQGLSFVLFVTFVVHARCIAAAEVEVPSSAQSASSAGNILGGNTISERESVEWQGTATRSSSLSLPRRRGEGWGEGLRASALAAPPLIRPSATSPPPRKGEGALLGIRVAMNLSASRIGFIAFCPARNCTSAFTPNLPGLRGKSRSERSNSRQSHRSDAGGRAAWHSRRCRSRSRASRHRACSARARRAGVAGRHFR